MLQVPNYFAYIWQLFPYQIIVETLKSIRIILFSILISVIGSKAFGQTNPILGHFFASEKEGEVILSWEIVAGSTCNGIQIYRSTDALSYNQIGDIPGICGNISFAQDYIFSDVNGVKNKTNYYKLRLGSSGYSPVISVEIIDINLNGYLIRPNPITESSRIYFNNETNSESLINIYDFKGIEVYSSKSQNDYFTIDGIRFNSGIYIFSISVYGKLTKIKGKLVVQ